MNRDHRLKKAADFRAIREFGRSWADRFLVVVVVRRELVDGAPVPPSRFGFSVSKRIGNAVQRNHIKRRLRTAVMDTDPALGWDVLVIARKAVANSAYLDLKRSTKSLLRKAGITTVVR